MRVVSKHFEEEVTVHGRQFILSGEGPVSVGRYEVVIREIGGRLLTRAPVRGRSPEDARDRALEVLHTMLGIEVLQDVIIAVATELAPGSHVELTEDAHAIHAELVGRWHLTVPLAIPREEIESSDVDLEALQAKIRAHFAANLRSIPR